MSETEEVAKRLYEACLSGSVEMLKTLIEKDPLILDRASSTECFSSDTPLHVAVLRGHLDFTNALLSQKSTLAAELDSRRCTPLHLASTEGHFKIVHELLRVNPKVCIARDQDGRTPLHLAVMKERVEVILELLGAKPFSVHDKLGRGETVLHLSVKYNRPEALKTLVKHLHSKQSSDMESLLNSRDDDGNNILHLAAALKQVNTIEYLLGIKSVKDHANDKNQNGSTALDVVEHCPNRDLKTMEIREFLLQAGVQRSNCDEPKLKPELPSKNPPRTEQKISPFWKWFEVDPHWIEQVHGHLITTAALTATMAYQCIMSPPGGVWQNDKKGSSTVRSYSLADTAEEDDDGHKAGHAILEHRGSYRTFLALNNIVLAGSLGIIMLAMSGFSIRNKFLTWSLVITVYITVTCMGAAYVTAINLVSPEPVLGDILHILFVAWLVLCSVSVAVLHSCHLLVSLWKKTKNMFPQTRRATNNIIV
ncbi:ankyrin repeat-containing protein At5g02620-like [Rhododendron vialii]|uniref:ankyrin repeat-containing protein At5g02620-like n=1 Tax=Rhododendron vialii TaxID=182163 RepID=UPI002660209A|nr:ankyrin repeat-containing protein At5g02620-like [Rhododendron vialii]